MKPFDSTSTSYGAVIYKFFVLHVCVRRCTTTSSNAVRTWHILLLVRTAHSANPRHSLRDIELDRRLRIFERIHVVHNTDLNHLSIAEAWAITPERASAVAAEVRGDLVAGVVTLLRDRLWVAGSDREAVAGDNDVG